MSSLLQKVKNYLHPNRRKFVCDSLWVQKSKNEISITEKSFLEVYTETRALASDIISKLEDNRKRVKALYSAFNAASDLIVIFDSHGTIVYVNTQFLNCYDFSEEQLIGTNIRDIYIADLIFESMWNTVIKNSTWEGDLVCIDSKTIPHIHLTKVLPIMNGAPEPIYYVCSQSKN